MKIVAPERRLRHAKAQAVLVVDRVSPLAGQARDVVYQARDMAGQARDMAGDKIIVARGWAAPRLDAAAHSIEEQLAPKLSAALSQAAAKIDPKPTKSRGWPMALLVIGVAIGAAGYALYRKNADQWADTLKESASDASHWVGHKMETVTGKASNVTDDATSKADELGGKADARAEHTSRKLP
ncbi:YtxH domain-containing protein [Streptosporangium sp. NBC_01755]|uniref:hypothetical protein n=1 Tax=unclassified Streptosporangium TaxID=2632669 RepID=UPI002DDC4682|nr:MULTISPECIES: hypothetical protein [unclassified Streptosporangium]WSA25200.1 YtxH domain-containing protein [Streptosporangium sp. NBC_01810]WSD03460.1 YtxH domain-containing protein [Streptosporangium sp. NBC_01755]